MREPVQIMPKSSRQATIGRVHKVVSQVPRCAAATASGGQCTGTAGSTGQGGGWVDEDGEAVPLCTTHLAKHRSRETDRPERRS